VTRDRIYQLEVSARRKIAAALARDGLLHPPAPPRDAPKRMRRPFRRPANTPA
jgi:hypothetical protein